MAPPPDRKFTVALLGNPNAGKTSLFNGLTGLRQKTGNYAGVTVDRHEGKYAYSGTNGHFTVDVIDLPGLYSLYPRSSDERIARQVLLDPHSPPDAVLVVVDASNLKRNLLLATQVIDLKFPTVVALNMMDEAEKQGIRIDLNGLSKTLGVPVIPVDSRHLVGFDTLKDAVAGARPSDSSFHDIQAPFVLQHGSYSAYIAGAGESPPSESADKLYRYNIINYLLARYVKTPAALSRKELTSRIDRVATHPVWGYAILLAVLFLVFQLIFYISEEPMAWIEQAFLWTGGVIRDALPAGQLTDLLVNGVIAGVSGVVMFVPQIAFLFLFIGFLEDSGYMARAGFIMDRLMRPFGLNGRSVIPLVSGTACAVPAIMSTRSISNLRERLITIFILPLVSCSARLPVYTLLIAIMYPSARFLGVFNAKGAVLFLLYMLGFAATLLTALLLKRVVKTRDTSFFVMELPVYRVPHFRNISLLVVNKVKVFIVEAGQVILAISVVLWFLSAHGHGSEYAAFEAQKEHAEAVGNVAAAQEAESGRLEHSYAGNLGHFIEPVIRPLGFDWKIGIALVTSFAAREVFVGTMSTIYKAGGEAEQEGIKQRLAEERTPTGERRYNGAACWSLLLFYAFALQCMSTVAVVKRETGKWKIALAQFAFMFVLAYISAFTAFHLLS